MDSSKHQFIRFRTHGKISNNLIPSESDFSSAGLDSAVVPEASEGVSTVAGAAGSEEGCAAAVGAWSSFSSALLETDPALKAATRASSATWLASSSFTFPFNNSFSSLNLAIVSLSVGLQEGWKGL